MERIELINERDRYSKVFDNNDKTHSLEFSFSPMHYIDDNDSWQDVSLTIEEDPERNEFRCLTNILQVTIKEDVSEDYNTVIKTDEGLILEVDLRELKYSNGNGDIEVIGTPKDTSYSSYRADDSTVIQAGVFEGVTDRYHIGLGLLKHDIVIEERLRDPSILRDDLRLEITYRMRVNSPIKITTQGIEKTEDFTTTEDISFVPIDDSEFAIQFQNANICDQAGIYGVVEQKLKFINDYELEVSYVIDYKFLDDDSLIYPLIIDPTSKSVSAGVSYGTPRIVDKTFSIGFAQTISWNCTLRGHSSMYTSDYCHFYVWDGAGTERVHKQSTSSANAQTFSGSFACSSSQIGTGKIRVRATNQYANGSGTVTYKVNTKPSCSCKSPTGGSWQKSSVTLSWNYSDSDGDPIKGSRIQVATDSGFSNTVKDVSPGATTSYSCTGLTSGTKYWRATVYDGLAWSGWCSAATFKVDSTAPTVSSTAFSVNSPTLDSDKLYTATVSWSVSDAGSGVSKSALAFRYGGTWYYTNGTLPDGITCSATVNSITGSGSKTVYFYNIPDGASLGMAWKGIDVVGNSTGWVQHKYITAPNRNPIARLKARTGSGTITIGIYPFNIMSNTILRIRTPNGTGCFWLASTSHSRASPIRIRTHKGTYAIVKE